MMPSPRTTTHALATTRTCETQPHAENLPQAATEPFLPWSGCRGNRVTDRPTSRVSNPPGGASQVGLRCSPHSRG
jgi:hypothetical protein